MARRRDPSPVPADVCTEPGAIGVHALDSVGEVRGEPAVFRKKVVPVTAIVAAVAEVGGDS